MEFNSPEQEHIQLNVKSTPNLLSQLNNFAKPIQSKSDYSNKQSFSKMKRYSESNLDSIMDGHRIPSPPLSPKINSVVPTQDVHNQLMKSLKLIPTVSDNEGANKENLIMVRSSWDKNLTLKKYRYATQGFLSQYKMFDNMYNDQRYDMTRKRNHTPLSRELRNNRLLTSDVERNDYQLRKFAVRKHYSNKSGDDDWSPKSPKRKSYKSPTPRHFQRNHVSHSGSGSAPILASSAAVSAVPQYIPNISWEKLPDYSPPTSSIPMDNTKALRIEWKGSPMDLSYDPLKSHLHPAEVVLAQILRLPCDLYLDSKRRLFLEKVYRMKKGLPFRRTDAQKACKIDVNKASRLFAAFEKVGWLNDSNFKQHLQ